MLVFKLKSAKTPALVIKPSDSEVGNILVVNAGDRAPRIPARAWLAASTSLAASAQLYLGYRVHTTYPITKVQLGMEILFFKFPCPIVPWLSGLYYKSDNQGTIG